MTEERGAWEFVIPCGSCLTGKETHEAAAPARKPIPWIRIIVDAALLAAMAVVSSRLF